jgi:hypothetical protein
LEAIIIEAFPHNLKSLKEMLSDDPDNPAQQIQQPQKSRQGQDTYSSSTSLKRSLPSAKMNTSESALSTNYSLSLNWTHPSEL